MNPHGADSPTLRRSPMVEVAELTKESVLEALRDVFDPEIPVNVVDLGLVYDCDVDGEGDVSVKMTLTFPGCGMGPYIGSAGRVAHRRAGRCRGRRGGDGVRPAMEPRHDLGGGQSPAWPGLNAARRHTSHEALGAGVQRCTRPYHRRKEPNHEPPRPGPSSQSAGRPGPRPGSNR